MSSEHSTLKVAVLGFGLMGAQISQIFAQNGYSVSAYDIDRSKLEDGLNLIRKGRYGLERAVESGRLDPGRLEPIFNNIKGGISIDDAVSKADLVVEAAFEELTIKQDLMKKALQTVPPETILTTNTSTLSIAKIASVLPLEARKRFAGMHFFNPPQIMKLVEVVRITETDAEVVSKIKKVATTLGKTPITVLDYPGFVANRIGISVFSEACELLEKNIASVGDIDTAMRLGYGYPVGPFELADIVGLDARMRNMQALYDQTGIERFKPPDSLKKLVSDGYVGDPKTKKGSKGGYYEYFRESRPQSK